MTILVTGGAGYIGSHVCKALKEAGYTPVTLDNLDQGHKWAVKWGPFVKGDIKDPEVLDHTFKMFQPCGIIHLASYTNVRESLENPQKYDQNNFDGTLSLLEATIKHNVLVFVFSSSAAVYGVPKKLPIGENDPKTPINPYGYSKWRAENALQDFAAMHGLSSMSLRYFNVAGADPEGEIGEAHDPETHLIARALLVLLKRHPFLLLHGTDHPTFDGTAIRDYVHVSDLAETHVKALKYLFQLKQPQATALNLGSGQGYSVRQIIDMIETTTKLSLPLQLSSRISGDPPELVADSQKAKVLLDWAPRYDLRAMIDTAWQWHKK